MHSSRSKKLGYKIYDPQNPQKIKLLRSFNEPEEIYGGRSFMQEYPFIYQECVKNKVSLMTFDEFIVFKSKTIDRNRLKEWSEDKSDDKEEKEKIGDPTIPIGVNARKFKLFKNAIVDGVNGERIAPQERAFLSKFIKEFFDSQSHNDLLKLVRTQNYRELYEDAVEPIINNLKEYEIGTAQDCLGNEIFKEYCKANLTGRFNQICQRDGKSLIGSDYIKGIVDANVDNIIKGDEDEILICLVNNDDNKIISFVSAESNPESTNDIIGQLICTAQGTSGLGKLQMASTLLLARDSNVSFVFIQAIQGYLGVQSALYSKLGFETDFKNYPEIMEREYAIRELTQVKYEYLRSGNALGILNKPAGVARAKMVQAYALLPMWIYAPSVNTKCMENIITKTGWDCRIGDYAGEGGMAKYLSSVPFSGGTRIQRTASVLSKLSGTDYSHARESYLASKKSSRDRSPVRQVKEKRRSRDRLRDRSPRGRPRERSNDRSSDRPRERSNDRSRDKYNKMTYFDIDEMKGRKYA